MLSNNWEKSAVLEALANDKNYITNTYKFDPKEAQKNICGLTKENEVIECGICYDEFEEKDILQVSECGHKACFECVQDYCKAKMGMGNDAIYTKCVECLFMMPESIFKKTLNEEEYERYQMYLRKSFVDLNS